MAHEVEGLEPLPMRRLDDGWFEAETLCCARAAYRFRIADDLAVIDPAARALRGRVFGDGRHRGRADADQRLSRRSELGL